MKYKKIGDILILDKYNQNDNNIEELVKIHKVKTIIKLNFIHGQKRVPNFKILYGNETETIHKENGCYFKLDLKKVMWSKGNVNERLRIAKLVNDNEIILDMFAGIGYFSIPIAVHSNPKTIYSIEINPDSYYYLNKNIELNNINKIKNISKNNISKNNINRNNINRDNINRDNINRDNINRDNINRNNINRDNINRNNINRDNINRN
ncbi:MAG: hypothetical protein LBM96_12045, partial [Methanobrevibacter sp.]|nr:hypothetical protein [Candidatus Methanoflexus mossambicus]